MDFFMHLLHFFFFYKGNTESSQYGTVRIPLSFLNLIVFIQLCKSNHCKAMNQFLCWNIKPRHQAQPFWTEVKLQHGVLHPSAQVCVAALDSSFLLLHSSRKQPTDLGPWLWHLALARLGLSGWCLSSEPGREITSLLFLPLTRTLSLSSLCGVLFLQKTKNSLSNETNTPNVWLSCRKANYINTSTFCTVQKQ